MSRPHLTLLVAATLMSAAALAADTPQPQLTPAAPAAPLPPSTLREVVKFRGWSMRLPLGLPAAAARLPDKDTISDQKIALGKLLYFDKRLSKDGATSCDSCHNAFHGFANPDRISSGPYGKIPARNAPTIINRFFAVEEFWDGRGSDLEQLAHGEPIDPAALPIGPADDVVRRVKDISGYAPLFKAAFGEDKIDIDRIGMSIATYERTVVSGDSAYDLYVGGNKDALSERAVRGLALFNGKGNCSTCHAGFNFTDESYQNIGVGMNNAEPDPGRFAVTKEPADRGKFKVPTLRNLLERAPYMHDGSEETLADVVEFYNRGGLPNPTLSKTIKPLKLSDKEKGDLLAFLESLSGPVHNADPPETFPK